MEKLGERTDDRPLDPGVDELTVSVDYVGQSTQANYTILEGEGWVGLVMSETVSPQFAIQSRLSIP